MSRYWYMECPICRQGRLFVEVHSEMGKLFLECEECSNAWNSPEQASARESAFLSIEIDSHFASAEEIEKGGWSKYKFQQASGTGM